MQPTRTNRSARTWGLRLRWSGAEFLVVVSGVLVAIALNAAFVDGLYQRALVASGLILPAAFPDEVGGRRLNLSDSVPVAGRRGGYVDDPLWSLPREDLALSSLASAPRGERS